MRFDPNDVNSGIYAGFLRGSAKFKDHLPSPERAPPPFPYYLPLFRPDQYKVDISDVQDIWRNQPELQKEIQRLHEEISKFLSEVPNDEYISPEFVHTYSEMAATATLARYANREKGEKPLERNDMKRFFDALGWFLNSFKHK